MSTVSKSEFARRMGISPAAVTKLCSSGRIPVMKNGKLNLERATAAYNATRQVGREVSAENGKRAAGTAVPSSSSDIPDEPEVLAGGQGRVVAQFNKAKTAEKVYQAKLRELEYKEKSGVLVAVDAVYDDATLAANELRNRLFAIAPRAAVRCEGKPAREIERIIEDEINEALKALQESRFQKKQDE